MCLKIILAKFFYLLSGAHSALIMIGEKTMKLLCTTVFTLAITTASFADLLLLICAWGVCP